MVLVAPARLEPLKAQGIAVASSVKEAVANSDIIFVVLMSNSIADKLLFEYVDCFVCVYFLLALSFSVLFFFLLFSLLPRDQEVAKSLQGKVLLNLVTGSPSDARYTQRKEAEEKKERRRKEAEEDKKKKRRRKKKQSRMAISSFTILCSSSAKEAEKYGFMFLDGVMMCAPAVRKKTKSQAERKQKNASRSN